MSMNRTTIPLYTGGFNYSNVREAQAAGMISDSYFRESEAKESEIVKARSVFVSDTSFFEDLRLRLKECPNRNGEV